MVSDKGDNKSYSLQARIILACSICITAVFGFLGGIAYRSRIDIPYHPIQFIDDINPYIPYLKILSLTEHKLSIETTDHTIRIENGENIYNAPPNSPFTLTVATVLAEENTSSSTENATCSFVAGKTGKYLYSAESTQAKKLSSSKRCFANLAEGEKAGLILWNKK